MGHQQSSMNQSRGDSHGDRHRHHDGGPTSPSDQDPYTSRTGRGSRRNLVSSLVGGGSNNEVPERRETRAEAKARRLERDRKARIEERERSIREEHVDGGYLVTMGVYIGPEDFNKAIVRQLMIERRLAPFWRGLEDYEKDWTENQLVAAGRGLPIPAADEVPTARSHSSDSRNASNSNLQNLMVPLAPLTQSTSYDTSVPSQPTTSTSLLRPRSKTLGLKSSSKEPAAPDASPREIQLPRDDRVNGQAIEAFLYKDSAECSICLIWYPPYLNRTRCCDQTICSECFVQIKRLEPHERPPPDPSHDPSELDPYEPIDPAEPGKLVSKPAACPYCQRLDFGVTYEPPPFRRGLVYETPSPEVANFSPAMSSSSSINSPPMTSLGLAPRGDRRRATSLSANDSHVITTDRIRPDWSTKLDQANTQRKKRFAAASALHAAAFVLPGPTENRTFGFRSFGRTRNDNNPEASGTATSSNRDNSSRTAAESVDQTNRDAQRIARQRMEDMMLAEAIRMSIIEEEERKMKVEKEAAKEAAKQAKKQFKEDKKKQKKERKSVYGASGNSASSSALNLFDSITGRRRGNSNASNLATEVTPEEVEEPVQGKGKGVDRSLGGQGSVTDNGLPGAQHSDPSTSSSLLETPQSIPSPTAPDRPSHLRQMSTASSASSSLVESRNGTNAQGSSASIDSPGASGTSYEGNEDGDAGPESMFNFRSIMAMVENEDDNEKRHSEDHVENVPHEASDSRHGSRDESTSQDMDVSMETIRASDALQRPEDVERSHPVLPGLQMPDTSINTNIVTPQLMVTPDTPAAVRSAEENGKQLGSTFEHPTNAEITQ